MELSNYVKKKKNLVTLKTLFHNAAKGEIYFINRKIITKCDPIKYFFLLLLNKSSHYILF